MDGGGAIAKILAQHRFELLQLLRRDVEDPLEVAAHLSLHLVDLAKGEHSLPDDAPRLVGVGIVAHDLRGDHKCRYEEAVTGRAPGSGETALEAVEEEERRVGNRGGEASAMEGICDEMCERGRGTGWDAGRCRRNVGT